jgi:chorismate dehydratase
LNTIKIGAVSYLNTKPLLYGLKQSNLMQQIELIEDYPAKIAQLFLNNKIDAALVPVAILPQINPYYFISNYCIGANKNVASVCLFSNVSIENIETVLLDYQSKTSVALAKILFKELWKKKVQFIDAYENYIAEIKGTTAAIVIGDRALQLGNTMPFIYDLAAAWQQLTQMPFVFATWVANKPMSANFMAQFDAAMQVGLNNIDAVVAENSIDYYDAKKYFTQNISYHFTQQKKEALQLFLQKLQEI